MRISDNPKKYKLHSLSKTVATAGTRVQCSTTITWVHKLRIKAPAGNAGVVYVGDSTVAAANGYELAAGESVSLCDVLGLTDDAAFNLTDIWFDAATNGDKLKVFYADQIL